MTEKITKATKNSWEVIPMDKPKLVYVDLKLTQEHFEKLQVGFMPRNMDDRWFVYFENDWIYFHRSWTGYEIFKAQIYQDNNGYFVKDFWVESNTEKFNLSDEKDMINTFCFILYRIVLRVELPEIQ